MSSVVVVGSFNVDHAWTCDALPRAGETLTGGYRSGAGGKGFNQTVAAARAGAATSFICALGDDVGAQLARALAVADGIDLRDERSGLPTGTAGIFVDAQGRNSIVIGAGANGALSTGFVDGQGDAIEGASVLLVQLESPPDAIAHALRRARRHGVLTVLNPAPANASPAPELLMLADILTPNETEFAALLARHLDESIDPDVVAGMDDAELHALCRRLLPDGTVLITLSASGVFVSHVDTNRRGDGHHWYRIAAEPAHAVDSTGAGDAFNGALAASLANVPQAAFVEHVVFANRYAALSTESAGAAASMPCMADMQARFP
jgi:ribokinase